MDLNRKVAIITDSGLPEEYARMVASLCRESKIITFAAGEENKSIDTYTDICRELLEFNLGRSDAIVAVGGGVCGDIAGFAAATYMRGVDFYNIPTTLLSQVDSSVGGKTAIDFCGVKNIIGAFYQPRAVLIDTDVLKTLDKRQFSAGLAEVVKMALTSDEELFESLENGLWREDIAQVIVRALQIKKDVVEKDEREAGLRRILNFGHTLGHGIEALGELYHGECVALGMIPMCTKEVRTRLIKLLCEMGLPTEFNGELDKTLEFMKHDKKCDGDMTYAIFVDKPGSYRIEKMPHSALVKHIKSQL
jgi:3-dehydroquinate synthase